MSIQVESNQVAKDAAAKAAAEPTEGRPSATPKEEPKEPAKSDPAGKEVESDDEEAGETEADQETESDEDKSASGKDDKPKNVKGGWQRRIDKKTREAADARRETEYWKSQALKGAAGDKPQESEAPVKTEAKGKPQAGDFETHAEFVEALTDWKTDQKLQTRDQEAQAKALKDAQQSTRQAFMGKAKSFAENHADYDDVLSEGLEGAQVSPTLDSLIVESENGPELIYELAKNREEFDRINRLPPLAAARELGKFESRITATTSTGTPKKQTKAPKPLEPVGGKGAVVEKDITDPAISQQEYEAKRRKQIAARASSGW